MKTAISLLETGFVPDALTRAGIRHLCRVRLAEESRDIEGRMAALRAEMMSGPVAPVPQMANE